MKAGIEYTKSFVLRPLQILKILESPTIESLALALQDGEDGVISNGISTNNPNSLENRCYIEELAVSKGQKIEIQMSGRFSNIAQGSAGQKTTALLSLILRSNAGPLIIDQPEDDLDTKLISEMLVKELRNQKEKNQVIVVTHNPNIPVNGAAEQILAMNFVGGQITCKFEGALQNQIIRNEICDVMEGGRDALKKRYFRIYKY